MTERKIQAALFKAFRTHDYKFTNTYFFKNESDWLSFTRSGYCYDIEVKVSRSDFFADFKKPRHKLMKGALQGKRLVVIKGKTYPWVCTFKYFNEYNYKNRARFNGNRDVKLGRVMNQREQLGRTD